MKVISIRPKMLDGTVEINESSSYFGAFFLVAGAIGNNIYCIWENYNTDKISKRIIEIIKSVGAIIEENKTGILARATANMKGTKIDCSGLDEVLPIVAVLCAFCRGTSRLSGLSGEKHRTVLKNISSELSHLGVRCEMTSDGLLIEGGQTLRGDGAYAWKSSELAIALTVASSRCEGEFRLMGTEELHDDKFLKFMEIYDMIDKETFI